MRLDGQAPGASVAVPPRGAGARGFLPPVLSLPELPAGEDSPVARAEARAAALEHELSASVEIGGLLLKNASEEAARVQARAQALVEAEFSVPRRELACGEERDACVRCYGEHARDPLACRDAVAAFTECSRGAFAHYAGVAGP